jgi:hypothetical protein
MSTNSATSRMAREEGATNVTEVNYHLRKEDWSYVRSKNNQQMTKQLWTMHLNIAQLESARITANEARQGSRVHLLVNGPCRDDGIVVGSPVSPRVQCSSPAQLLGAP